MSNVDDDRDINNFDDSDDDDLEYRFVDLKAAMHKATENLKIARTSMNAMRWQFGGFGLKEFKELYEEIDLAVDGWMSSAC